MPLARKDIVNLDDTPYYHCISRCVRKSFFLGEDPSSGKNFGHRKQWILDTVDLLERNFAVDVCAYAVMDNHYHLVLKMDTEAPLRWSRDEVLQRWKNVFKTPSHFDRVKQGETPEKAAIKSLDTKREALGSMSHFMKTLNERIARRANVEDGCTGKFWEGRFTSQALYDEASLLACMAYVDLNPVRAGAARLPEEFEYSSFKERIREYAEKFKKSYKAAMENDLNKPDGPKDSVFVRNGKGSTLSENSREIGRAHV